MDWFLTIIFCLAIVVIFAIWQYDKIFKRFRANKVWKRGRTQSAPQTSTPAPTAPAPTTTAPAPPTPPRASRWGGAWNWAKKNGSRDFFLLLGIVIGIHYLLHSFYKEQWEAMAKKPEFWVIQILVFLIFQFFRKEVEERGTKSRKLTWMGKLAICILLVIGWVTFKGDVKGVELEKLKGMLPVVTLTPPASSSVVRENKIVVVAPVDGWSEKINLPARNFVIWYGGDVYRRDENGVEVTTGPTSKNKLGLVQSLEFKSREDKPVTVTIIFK